MDFSWIHVHRGKTSDFLMPMLKYKIFHITRATNWDSILRAKCVKTNVDGNLDTTFGSSGNSYFRNRGCVSLFDYRKIDDKEPQKHIGKCWPTIPLSPDSSIAVLFVESDIWEKLENWSGWKREEDVSQMVVPHVEIGHPGPISIEYIEHVLFVSEGENADPMAAMYPRSPTARRVRGGGSI